LRATVQAAEGWVPRAPDEVLDSGGEDSGGEESGSDNAHHDTA